MKTLSLNTYLVRHTRTKKKTWADKLVKAGTAHEAARKALKADFASVMWASGSEVCQPWHFVSDPLDGKNQEAHVWLERTVNP